MDKSIYLVRHGQASFGAQNYDQLSPLGARQSQTLGEALAMRQVSFDTTFSGTLSRHRQTANHAAVRVLEESPNWNEFDHEGIFRLLMSHRQVTQEQASEFSPKQILKFFSEALEFWSSQKELDADLETWPQFKQRVQLALDETVAKTTSSSLVFTSGGPISVVIGHLMGFTRGQILALNWQLVNTGITKLVVRNERPQVSTVNEYVHLETQSDSSLITYK